MLREGPVKLEALLATFGPQAGKVASLLQATFWELTFIVLITTTKITALFNT